MNKIFIKDSHGIIFRVPIELIGKDHNEIYVLNLGRGQIGHLFWYEMENKPKKFDFNNYLFYIGFKEISTDRFIIIEFVYEENGEAITYG